MNMLCRHVSCRCTQENKRCSQALLEVHTKLNESRRKYPKTRCSSCLIFYLFWATSLDNLLYDIRSFAVEVIIKLNVQEWYWETLISLHLYWICSCHPIKWRFCYHPISCLVNFSALDLLGQWWKSNSTINFWLSFGLSLVCHRIKKIAFLNF